MQMPTSLPTRQLLFLSTINYQLTTPPLLPLASRPSPLASRTLLPPRAPVPP